MLGAASSGGLPAAPLKMNIRPRSLHVDDKLQVLWADRDAEMIDGKDGGGFKLAV